MTRRRAFLWLLMPIVVAVLTGDLAARTADVQRTVYISAVDSKGAAIADLTSADVTVKENGKDAAIASLTEATDPMDVAILVDDDGGGFFQAGVLQVLQTLGERAKFSITLLTPQAEKLLDYTNDDVSAIQVALDRLVRRNKLQAHGDQLAEAMSTAARELQRRKTPRRVLLVMTLSAEGQVKNADIDMKQLQNSGAALELVFGSGANFGLVTGDGPKQSGGMAVQAGSTSALGPAVTRSPTP